MKVVPKHKTVLTYSQNHQPVEYVDPGELIILEAEDALGGALKDESATLEELDWSRVAQATGPVHVKTAAEGDTLVASIVDIEVADKGVILTISGSGALADRQFKSQTRIVNIRHGFAEFKNIRLKLQPAIGTIGVAPYGEPLQTTVAYKHGGNFDCAEINKGTRLYLPVATDGALLAAGDLHAVQEDGELGVAAVEVAGRILLKFEVIKGKQAEWPILETRDHFSILTADESLDKAVKMAAEKAVEALMNSNRWSFEDAYMFSSLAVKVAINQVVDPKRGARAKIPREHVTIDDLLTR